MRLVLIFLALAVGSVPALGTRSANADEALVAVATNFATTAEALAPRFAQTSGHSVRFATGSTGKLFAQIRAGAPFDAFLSADTAAGSGLLQNDLAVPGSAFVYAVGRLVLVGNGSTAMGSDPVRLLLSPSIQRIAVPAPDVAPYGRASQETLEALGLWAPLQEKLVMGQNVGQAFSMIHSGAANVGFVALSQLVSPRVDSAGEDPIARGSVWIVPEDLHAPIEQAAILTRRGRENAAAIAFLAFLREPSTRRAIEEAGYRLPPTEAEEPAAGETP